jgi:hypothetical protein
VNWPSHARLLTISSTRKRRSLRPAPQALHRCLLHNHFFHRLQSHRSSLHVLSFRYLPKLAYQHIDVSSVYSPSDNTNMPSKIPDRSEETTEKEETQAQPEKEKTSEYRPRVRRACDRCRFMKRKVVTPAGHSTSSRRLTPISVTAPNCARLVRRVTRSVYTVRHKIGG